MSSRLPDPGASDALYVVDLSGYVFRAYHAMPPLSSPTGEPTHAAYTTTTMLIRLMEDRRPAYLAVAMDSRGKTFRYDLDARYKAHRPPAPPDLASQMERARQIVEAYRIPTLHVEGVEADDLIASLVPLARAARLRVVIASADKDLTQLVTGEDVVLWDAMRDRVYGEPEVKAKYGVPPSQMRDLLALVGDTSDNVPGVPGVGDKTAAELLATFGSIDGVYERLDEVKKPRIRENLRTNREDCLLSRALVTLKADVPIPFELDRMRHVAPDTERLRALFSELGFTRLVKNLPAAVERQRALEPRVVATEADLAAALARVRATGRLALDLVLTTAEPMGAALVGVVLAPARGESFYVPVGHVYLGAPPQLDAGAVLGALAPLLEDPAIAKLGHDLKRSAVFLLRRGIALRGAIMDTQLASYLVDPEAENALRALAKRELGLTLPDAPEAPKKRGGQQGLEDLTVETACAFVGANLDAVVGLSERYLERLTAEHLAELLRTLELPLSEVLARMEHAGVLVDPRALAALGVTMNEELARLEKAAREAAGRDFNVGSPKQLEAILFDVLGLKSTRKTKTGRSTDAEALEAIEHDHALPGIILEHRAMAKLKGTYVDALPRLVHPETGRIHTRWSQAVAATGRLSSQDPNLQNIPVRTELGKRIRRAFPAPPGQVVLSADYSQIELRILAHLSKDPLLVDAFLHGEDVHVRTAMEVFGVDRAGVTGDMRRSSKTINFGVIYGMGEVALAKRLGVPRAEAARFIGAYFERYAGVRAFFDETLRAARATETVYTLLGRRRVLPDLRSSDRMRRSQAERIAQNTPIQGTAADLLKRAMVRLGAEPLVPGARMVLTVHDELVFEVPEGLVEQAASRAREVMQSVAELSVPLVVDVGWGPTWADAH